MLPTITNIQLLRGIAALMVVLFHLTVKLQPFGLDGSEIGFLQSGVDIFFVISGFIMVHVSRSRERSAGRFLADRIVRIVPLYWLLTAATFVLFPMLGHTGSDLVRSFLFIPGGEAPLYKPVIGAGWTLNLEMYFYCLFALGLALARSETGRFALVSSLLLLVIAGAGWMPGQLWHFYGDQIVLEFVAGMALAQLRERIGAIRPRAAIVLAAASALAIATDPWAALGSRALSWGLPAAAIVTAALALDASSRRVSGPLPLTLGAASYALYLSHGLAIGAVLSLFGRPGAETAPALVAATCLFALIASLAGAWLVHTLFERPMTSALKRALAIRAGSKRERAERRYA